MVTGERSGVTSTDVEARTEDGSDMTRARIKVRRRARKSRARIGFMQLVKPNFDRLLGQLELALLTGLNGMADIYQEPEWTKSNCPAIVLLFVNKQREFARFVMDAANQDEAAGSLMSLQRAWDIRKTKQDTEERSLHETGYLVSTFV